MDEIWSFICKKNKNVKPGDPLEYGDCWTYIALKSESGLIVSSASGKHTEQTCKIIFDNLYYAFDLPFPDNKFIFFTDKNIQYEDIIKETYSESCMAYGRIIKTKKENKVIEIKFETVFGSTVGYKISTSVVEGYNNKMRQKITFFVRKTAAFSKSKQSFIARINIFKFANNFIDLKMERIGLKTIKMRTPAMIEGIADHAWTWKEFLTCNAVKAY